MRHISAYILLAITLMSGTGLMAQSDFSMATHWNNRAYYNPAFITRTDYLFLYTNVRRQWMGIKGAPEVLNIQASQYFQSMRSALGLSLVIDKIGITRTYNPMVTYAFRLAKKDAWTLSMGLSAGIFSRSVNGSLFEAEDAQDPSLFYYNMKTVHPDVNAGIEFQNIHFIYGISSTHLFSMGRSDSLIMNTNHRYAYAIYKNDNPQLFTYTLGAQIINNNKHTILEGNLSVRIKHKPRLMEGTLLRGPQEILDFGLTCRSSRQMTFNFGMMFTSYIRIGYSYDQSLFSAYSLNQTHEIMLEYRIPARSSSPTVKCGDKEYWYH
ncbi:MAG: PorP/SprF family type IX secretion system membrane protein [Bacteroidia bacterium]|nr:PorP/SprF family type IX secretion system membrane protein [Bacteroidia bacterium]